MVFEKIQEIIAEELGKETEDEFDVKIETEDGIKTVQDLVTYVEKQTA